MPDAHPRRTIVNVSWSALFKVLAVVVLVWLWLQLVQLFLVLVVALLLAVSLNPIVAWFERRHLPRWGAATLVAVTLLCIVLGFLWLTWTSLADQAQYAASHFQQLEKQAVDALPGWVRNAVTPDSGDLQSAAAPYALRVGKSAVAAVVVAFLGFIVMLYLLIEADRTKAWFMAFVPKAQRARVEETLDESERVVFAYVAGNVITSVLAGVFIGVSTALLKVPGALLLAFVAAVFDFIPVMGFILSSVFGVVMALTVSPATAVIVFCLYVAYHFAENYVIGPWAYGGRLKLSNLAVVLAFAIGAEIAGVIGALIALPVAAVYPSIERIWLREELPEDTVRRHRAIERRAG